MKEMDLYTILRIFKIPKEIAKMCNVQMAMEMLDQERVIRQVRGGI